MRTLPFLLFACGVLFSVAGRAQEQDTTEYLEFVRAQAAQLRSADFLPHSGRDWHKRETKLREELLDAWGGFPKHGGAIRSSKLGELQRDGYKVEKVIFETLRGVWMTANTYVPDRVGKLPALLMVHGHWRGAKQDPTVQARCIGAAKLGFFVLAVDAFGAGERGVGKALGQYHGDMTAATLLPVGLPLSGIQVYENMRAIDYLRSRREVDPERIGVSGASGGGNQSMYIGAWDKRLAAVAPVCSVGNYQAYLGAACCMCEVVPGALRFTEEWGLLAMVAPRALMVVNATRDSRQFSVEESNKSIAAASIVFGQLGHPENIHHVTFESGHDYSQPMREAVYGWMTLHLKKQGNGAPVPEPPIKTEDPEMLRCFPGDSRPDDWVTIPRFAAAQGTLLVGKIDSGRISIHSKEGWLQERMRLREALQTSLGGFPKPETLQTRTERTANERAIAFTPENGIHLRAHQQNPGARKVLIALDLEGGTHALNRPELQELANADWSVVSLSLRATGEHSWPTDKVGRAPDHTSAEWGLWIGRPLLGQWVWDVRRLLDALAETDGKLPAEIAVVGFGPAGVVALTAAALDERIGRVAALDSLASYVSDTPYERQRLGIMVPAILKNFGDIPDLAALVAPRRVLIAGGVRGSGREMEGPELRDNYIRAQNAFALLAATPRLQIAPHAADALARFLAD